MKTNITSALTLLLSACILSTSAPALAQETLTPQTQTTQTVSPAFAPNVTQGNASQVDILPVKSADDANVVLDETNPTHNAVKLTPDKSELIRLDRKAAVVLVGNPAHLSILPEGANTLVLVPRAPGATYFTVLDSDNKVIMQRHVIVSGPQEKYVRIRKTCSEDNCQPTQVYYCPDMCHEIILNAGQSNKDSSKNNSKAAPSITTEAEEKPADENSEDQTGEEGGESEPTE